MENNRHIKIQLFGILKERIAPEIMIQEPLQNVKELREFLEATYLPLNKIPYLVAVDRKIASAELPLNSEAEIALLPPFSGG
ncbi:MAG: MoaD/ThiS family protein [Alphaproteobacteria bacterium]|jgi:molybdopterin synthase sulfur carrier subunit|nr:MoaD/ThiS family protein [Alphaproteobacteria bacterium]